MRVYVLLKKGSVVFPLKGWPHSNTWELVSNESPRGGMQQGPNQLSGGPDVGRVRATGSGVKAEKTSLLRCGLVRRATLA